MHPVLDASASPSESPAFQQQVERIRRALGDLAVEVDMAGTPPSSSTTANGGETLISTEAFPRIRPSLSDAIIAEREDSR